MPRAFHAARVVIGFALGADRRRTLAAVTLITLSQLGPPAAALLAKYAFDSALAQERTGAAVAAAAVGAIWLAMLMARHFAVMICYELGDLVSIAFDERLMELANGSPGIEHHERPDYADRLALLREEAPTLWTSFDTVVDTFAFSAQVVFTAVLLATVSPLLLVLPLFAVPALAAGRRAHAISEEARLATAEGSRLATHLLQLGTETGAAKELRLFGLEEEIRARQARTWAAVTETRWAAQRRALVTRSLGQFVFALGYIGALVFVSAQAVRGQISAGDVLLTIVLVGRINQQAARAVGIADTMRSVVTTVTRFEWLQTLAQPEQAGSGSPVPARLTHGLTLSDVSFTYPATETAVLKGITLDIPAGATVAIVGENGAGKTTLVKLLCRFYDPTAGSIELDGADLRALPIDSWRERIAAQFQDFLKLEATARETIGIGDVQRIDDNGAIQGALARAGAERIVEQLPEELATHLGKNYADGVEPSGGQWQRLALARALMRDSPLLLILDEPSSALDAEAEHALFTRYTESAHASGDRTGAITIFTSHRFSTVRMADTILVLEQGVLTEHGTHSELMARRGLYAELYELQARSYR